MPCPELLPPRAAQGGSSSAHLTRGYSHWIRERDVPVRTSEQMVRSIPRLAWARCRLAMCRSTRHRPLSGVSLLQGIRSLTARIAGRPRASFAALMLSRRSEEHTSELQSLMRISYAVFCLKKKKQKNNSNKHNMTSKKSNRSTKNINVTIWHINHH